MVVVDIEEMVAEELAVVVGPFAPAVDIVRTSTEVVQIDQKDSYL